MRQALVVLFFLAANAPVAPALAVPDDRVSVTTPQAQSVSCGPDAPDGMILLLAQDENDTSTSSSLVVVDPTNSVRRTVDFPDPVEDVHVQSGCKALVRTGGGVFYVVSGSTGEAYPLDFMDPADEWRYDSLAGGKRYGLFDSYGADMLSERKAILVDFDEGFYWDLAPLITEKGDFGLARFTASDDYLAFDAGPEFEDHLYLMPLDHPDQAQAVGPSNSIFGSFDESEERFMYLTFNRGIQDLIVQDIATGEWQIVATDPTEKEEYDPFLSGWFIPGHDDQIAVLHADRFALVDISGPEPVELFVIEGHRPFSNFVSAPSGKKGILTWQPATTFVDLDRQTSRDITTDTGEPINVTGGSVDDSPDRWLLATVGDHDLPETGYGVVDPETGTFQAFDSLPGEEIYGGKTEFSDDGRIMLLVTSNENGPERLLLVDNKVGTVDLIAEASAIEVTLSADARWCAYSTSEQIGEKQVTSVTVLSISDGTSISLGPGQSPIWLEP